MNSLRMKAPETTDDVSLVIIHDGQNDVGAYLTRAESVTLARAILKRFKVKP